MALLISSCVKKEKAPEISAPPVAVHSMRFEEDLMNKGASGLDVLRNKYPDFFDLYFFQVVRIGTPDSSLLRQRVADYVSDSDIVAIHQDVRLRYSDFSLYDKMLGDALGNYKYYFPKRVVPHALTFISGFNNAILCADSVLGIGLDMYLGKDSRYYPALKFPAYRISKMSGEYIVPDAMRGWLQTEWVEPETNSDLLSHMIYAGKILYAMKMLLPEEEDSILTGYSSKQVEWCKKNEKSVWSFFIEHKLLFSTEQNQIIKYVSEGPTTNGFPKESPGNIGQWIGYRIVDEYMNSKKDLPLNSLMNDNDYKKILQESKYKPG